MSDVEGGTVTPSEKSPLLGSFNNKSRSGSFKKSNSIDVVPDIDIRDGQVGGQYNTLSRQPVGGSITVCLHGNADGDCTVCESDSNSDCSTDDTHCHKERSQHILDDKKAKRKLLIASCLCLVFMIGEVFGGYFADSLAIMTDAAHLLTDFASFMISLFALWVASRPATKQMHWGYYRAEVIGALVSVLLIWVITGILVYLAVMRIVRGEYEIDAPIMLITAGVGVVINLFMGFILHSTGHGHSHGGVSHAEVAAHSHEGSKKKPMNVNVRAAFIHVLGDLVQSIGVMVAAIVIYFKPEYKVADPICTFLFSVLVLVTTLTIMRDIVNVLMEGAPRGIEFNDVKNLLSSVPGVMEVHNLRIWALTMNKVAMSAHLAIDPDSDPRKVLKQAQRRVKYEFNVFESTVQVEDYKVDMQDCVQCKDPKD
ncbi:PREDICTED: zinc transporter 2-like [Priapulus caudatus]|uniref:Zinc transporter 2-like n=1 Tax=Priapulus caudatus TaxID=37621 RepID=A0ABM1E8U9_PRICU|nr:PREDICTED: zinc transporter 2-like [Priapulus caudatus]